MHVLIQDVRYALRQLRRSPGFAATAILTLALGIGATTAIFTLVYQVILRSIPVAHPEQLYKVGKTLNCCVMGGGQDDWSLFSNDLYRSLRDHTRGLEGMAAVEAGAVGVSARTVGQSSAAQSSAAQSLAVRFVSGNYFSLLGVQPFAGRLLTPDDDREGAAPAAVLSYTLWRTKFAANPHLVGSTVLLTGHPVTVVGISAQNFLGERNGPDPAGLWLPLAQEPTLEPDRKLMHFPAMNWLDLLVRIKNPREVPHLQLALQGELRQWIGAHRELQGLRGKQLTQQTTELVPASSGINDLRDQYEQSLKLLLSVAGFVLLIACANLVNLMLVRGMARQQELAVRSALGAPRLRLVRQMLVEAVLLAMFGGTAALLVAYTGIRAILALALKGVEVSPLTAAPSLPVLGFAFAVSLLTGVLFGIAPAWIASRSSPVEALRGANRSTGDASALPQKLLAILQAALSLALLSTAGLLITSLRALKHQNFHFEPRGRLLVSTDLHAAAYTYPRLAGLYQRIDDAFQQVPNVVSFSYATYGPMTGGSWGTSVFFPGVPPDNTNNTNYTVVSPGFFSSVGTHILLGRGISEHDTATSVHVAVVNQTFVETFFKGRQPIGEHFGPDPKIPGEFEIVGVVENTKYGPADSSSKAMFFTPMAQATVYTDPKDIANENYKHFAGNLIVQYRGSESSAANSIRQTLKSIDPEIPILHIVPYEEQLSDNFTQEELVARLSTLFGILALLLAAIGLYGVTAYTVARRTGEIGIRMALGASRSGMLAMIVRSALIQAAIGLGIGIPLSLMAGRFVQHTLFQTSFFQPLVLLSVVSLLLAATLVAAIIPARRAASINPTEALRTQ